MLRIPSPLFTSAGSRAASLVFMVAKLLLQLVMQTRLKYLVASLLGMLGMGFSRCPFYGSLFPVGDPPLKW